MKFQLVSNALNPNAITGKISICEITLWLRSNNKIAERISECELLLVSSDFKPCFSALLVCSSQVILARTAQHNRHTWLWSRLLQAQMTNPAVPINFIHATLYLCSAILWIIVVVIIKGGDGDAGLSAGLSESIDLSTGSSGRSTIIVSRTRTVGSIRWMPRVFFSIREAKAVFIAHIAMRLVRSFFYVPRGFPTHLTRILWTEARTVAQISPEDLKFHQELDSRLAQTLNPNQKIRVSAHRSNNSGAGRPDKNNNKKKLHNQKLWNPLPNHNKAIALQCIIGEGKGSVKRRRFLMVRILWSRSKGHSS